MIVHCNRLDLRRMQLAFEDYATSLALLALLFCLSFAVAYIFIIWASHPQTSYLNANWSLGHDKFGWGRFSPSPRPLSPPASSVPQTISTTASWRKVFESISPWQWRSWGGLGRPGDPPVDGLILRPLCGGVWAEWGAFLWEQVGWSRRQPPNSLPGV